MTVIVKTRQNRILTVDVLQNISQLCVFLQSLTKGHYKMQQLLQTVRGINEGRQH